MSYDRSPFSLTPWVRRLLVATAAVFLLQKTVFYGGALIELFSFAPTEVLRRPWGALTYALLSGAPAGASVNPVNGTFTWVSRNECPPSSKKLSSAPMRSTPKTLRQCAATPCSIGPCRPT